MNRRRTLEAAAIAFILVVAAVVTPAGPEGAATSEPQASVNGTEHQVVLDRARHDAEAAPIATARSKQHAAELKRQLDLLHARPTDLGLVFTLGDVLFTSGRADLQPSAMGNLNRLVTFLAKYPDRRVAIHGYADSLGDKESNQGLSERRANSVKSYLAAQGVDSTRLSASGMGQSDPVTGDNSGAGRQQNRRVEVIISNPPAAVPQRARTAKMLALLALLEALSGKPARPLL